MSIFVAGDTVVGNPSIDVAKTILDNPNFEYNELEYRMTVLYCIRIKQYEILKLILDKKKDDLKLLHKIYKNTKHQMNDRVALRIIDNCMISAYK